MGNVNITTLTPVAKENVLVQAFWMVTFALCTAIGAQVEIPHQPVPYTFQTFFVLLSGALLGKRNGAISQALYLLAGVLGVPVFAHWGFGVARLLGPTGGYLLSFPMASFAVGYLIPHRHSLLWSIISMIIGLFIIFSLGTLQLNFIYFHNLPEAITNGFLIFSWWDAIKLFAAAAIAQRFMWRVPKV
ncbi:MAG: biotin transporter BioY [Ignavibacteria bacterium]|nr:biotin transporter BioY [Ignavibacteria bacterium]MBI3766415.1 biotin transporter BioY [Ignavibacteriales bacterium]